MNTRSESFWSWLFLGLFCLVLAGGLGYSLLSGGITVLFQQILYGVGGIFLLLIGGFCLRRSLQHFLKKDKE